MENLSISLPEDLTRNFIELDFEFGRINVVMGANGVGKSYILKRILNHKSVVANVKYIEGGRVVVLNPLEPTQQDYNHFGNYEKTEQQYRNNHRNPLKSRIKPALFRLDQKETKLAKDHSNAVTKWKLEGKIGECPDISGSPLQDVFNQFSLVFPNITLSVQGQNKQIYCQKGDAQYPANSLSDGEKQVLTLLADLLGSEDEIDTLVIDEPELNLNPSLAMRFWSMLEQSLPKIRFIYATHNLSFALRNDVDRLFIISQKDGKIKINKSFGELDTDDARLFLGSIPSIVVTNNAILVEGTESSIDTLFYDWVLEGSSSFKVFPSGDCKQVLSTVYKKGFWRQFAPMAKVSGIIDRDFKSVEMVAALNKNKFIVVLDYHEAESYLCSPKLISSLAIKIGTMENPPSENECILEIIKFANLHLARVALTRTIENANPLKLEKSLYGSIQAVDTMRDFIKNHPKNADLDEKEQNKFRDAYDNEVDRLQTIIGEKNVEKILRYFPGKELLNTMSKKINLNDPKAIVIAARKHLKFEDLPYLVTLRSKLNKLIE